MSDDKYQALREALTAVAEAGDPKDEPSPLGGSLINFQYAMARQILVEAANPSAIADLLAERDRLAELAVENEGAFQVWRRRCQDAERELAEARRDAAHFAGRVANLELEHQALRKALDSCGALRDRA